MLSSLTTLLGRRAERLPTAVAWAAGIACVLGLWHRFHFGTDLTDETFSIAIPYRFALGDKPFVDEASIQQTAGIVLFPFVWLYVKLTRGTTGLVMFVRFVHLLFKAMAAFSVYEAAKRWLRHRSVAIAVSFAPFAFVPHSIPNVGYNVIGTTLIVVGTFLIAAGIAEKDEKKRRRLFFISGFAQGVMAFAYPPMVVAPLLSVVLVALLAWKERALEHPRHRVPAFAAITAGGVASFLVILPSLAWGGIAGIRYSLGWGVHATMPRTEDRLRQLFDVLWDGTPGFYSYALVAIFVAWILRSRALVAIVVPGVVLTLVLWYRDDSAHHWCNLRTVIYAGFLAPPLVLLAKPDSDVLRGSASVVVPSYAAGAAAMFISTQNSDASSLGLHASMVLLVVLAARALERAKADALFCMLPAFALMVALVVRSFDFVYRDQPIAKLTDEVMNGPYKGIRTTPQRAQMFHELRDIVRELDRPGGRILFMYENPGLYLFSKMPPAADCPWQVAQGDQTTMLKSWQRYPKGNGYVIRMKGSGAGRIDSIIAPPDRLIRETRYFQVYRDQ